MQAYCSVADLVADLDLPGVRDEAKAVRFIEAVGRWLAERFGDFIPVTAVERLDGEGGTEVTLPRPLLSLTSIVDDVTTLTASDYLLYPRSRLWSDGPYCRISIHPDATAISTWSVEPDILVITGLWGLYNKTRSTGATVSSQTDSATSLDVSNGAKISPGMVLLIGSEQEYVEATGSPTDSTANLNETLTASDEQVTVTDGTKVFAKEVIRIDFEQMKVLEIQSNTLLVERGWNGTKKTTHSTATDVYVYRSFTVQRAVNGTTAAAHSSASISQYAAPREIEQFAIQMAALKLKLAQAAYAQKTGSPELGEVFYVEEFPKEALRNLGRLYFYPVV